jgi:hypothetical protein
MNSGINTFIDHHQSKHRLAPVLKMMVIEGGFPHSEIFGSKLVRSSPKLIAAYHVLHRLSAPRHPPNALKALDRSHHQCPPLGRGGSGEPETDGHDVERPDYCLRTHPAKSCGQA